MICATSRLFGVIGLISLVVLASPMAVSPQTLAGISKPVSLPVFGDALNYQSNPDGRHAPQADTDWDIETVDSEGDVGKYTSIALDNSGHPHISYFDDTNNDLKYAHQGPMDWSIETADSGTVYGHTSLDLDSAGYPHVSYYGSSYKALKYAYRDAAGWHDESVNAISIEYIIGQYSAIALDGDGYPHISYYKEYNYRGYLMYAYQDAGGWHIETAENPEGSGRYPGQYTSLALDAEDHPHISYYHGSDLELKYAYKDDSGWHIETADSNGRVGKHTSLELDDSGTPHISYFHSDNNDLKYTYRDGAGWHTETVDSGGDVGSYTSLELDDHGYPHISYCDFGNDDLKYAYRDIAGWHVETVDSEGDVGEYISLALDADGRAAISYYDGSHDALKYAHRHATVEPPRISVYLPLVVRHAGVLPPTNTPTVEHTATPTAQQPPSTATPTETRAPTLTSTPSATSSPTPTETATPTATPTPTLTPTATATPTQGPFCANGIYGQVTYTEAAAPGIELRLRFDDGASWSTAATTSTDGDGRYCFAGAPSIGVDQTYYVRYGPNTSDERYVGDWYCPYLTSYEAGSKVHGGDFDIANVELVSPEDRSTLSLPAIFTWERRAIPGSTYGWGFRDPNGSDTWWTGDRGDVTSYTLNGLPSGAIWGWPYDWYAYVFQGPENYGTSFEVRRMWLSPILATTHQTPIQGHLMLERHE